MNIAVIFAGGKGQRMGAKDKPKQFLLVHGKPIIIHTIEVFERHPQIDAIVVVCVKDWISYMEEMVYRYRVEKVKKIVAGGKTGQLSIYNGLTAAAELYGKENHTVLIHDGVRPLIDASAITSAIEAVKIHGSAITCAPATETFLLVNNEGGITEVPDREHSRIAKAPQCFSLKEIMEVQERAIAEGHTDVIDSCTLMRMYGKELYLVEGAGENIKITTPDDFYMFRALYDARENRQIGD